MAQARIISMVLQQPFWEHKIGHGCNRGRIYLGITLRIRKVLLT